MPNPQLGRKLVFALVPTLLLFATLELLLLAGGIEPRSTTSDPYVGFAENRPLYRAAGRTGADPTDVEWLELAPGKERFFNASRFARARAPQTRRIFCVGGSTTYGRPFRDPTSFCGWLRTSLDEAAPGAFEVINAGGISYASYRVAAVVRELAGYSPDLVVIYTGHNEFLEDRTYAELRDRSAFVRNADLVLGHTRLYTLAHRLVGGGPEQLPAEVSARLDASIGPDAYSRDAEWNRAVTDHFRMNLARIIESTRAADAIPLVVVPADNLGDCSPFKSQHRAALSDTDRVAFDAAFAAGESALRDGDHDGAVRELRRAVAIDPLFAGAHYALGRALLARGESAEAQRELQRARDEDVCPLRAPTPILEATRQIVAEQGVASIDFPALLGQKGSPSGVRDAHWFLDHVHPTIEGHRVLSRALFAQIEELGWLPDGTSSNEALLARAEQRVRGGIDEQERGLSLRNLAKVLSWAGKNEDAARAAREALRILGDDAECLFILSLEASDRGDHLEAVALLRETVRLDPDWIKPLHNLGVELARSGRDREAIETYDVVVARQPTHPSVHFNRGNALARIGELEEAAHSYERALELDSGDEAAIRALREIREELASH